MTPCFTAGSFYLYNLEVIIGGVLLKKIPAISRDLYNQYLYLPD